MQQLKRVGLLMFDGKWALQRGLHTIEVGQRLNIPALPNLFR